MSRLNMGVHKTTGQPSWRTPRRVFDELDAEFHFTLDPCASAPIRPDIRWFAEVDQGLWQPWSGRVFINPPYGREIVDWMRKVSLERDRCEVIVALIPSRTDSGWWHENVMTADEIRFVRGRIHFEGYGTGAAPFPSAIVVYRGSESQEVASPMQANALDEATYPTPAAHEPEDYEPPVGLCWTCERPISWDEDAERLVHDEDAA